MDQDIRWKQRFENLTKALDRFNEALDAVKKEPDNHLYQMALACGFQFTFELCWKTMKDYLVQNGVDTSLPRDVIKQAFHHELIQNGQIWIDMLEDRNRMNVYQEQTAQVATKRICEHYGSAINGLYTDFLKK